MATTAPIANWIDESRFADAVLRIRNHFRMEEVEKIRSSQFPAVSEGTAKEIFWNLCGQAMIIHSVDGTFAINDAFFK